MNQAAEYKPELEKRYRVAALIAAAQAFSVLVMIALAWFLAARSDNSITGSALNALWMMILLLGVGTFVLRRVLFSWERLKNVALLKGISGLLAALQTNTIILNSLAETIAVVGFLIAVLSGNKWEMFRAGAIALIVFLLTFPRKSVWEKIVAGVAKN